MTLSYLGIRLVMVLTVCVLSAILISIRKGIRGAYLQMCRPHKGGNRV